MLDHHKAGGVVGLIGHAHMSAQAPGLKPGLELTVQHDARPAGFSEKWLGYILRGQLGFGGAVFSDDLSMAGARLLDGKQVSYSEAAVAALNAGCDMVLLCNQSLDGGAAVDELLEGMTRAVIKGQWEPLESSENRRLALLPTKPAVAWDELMLEPAYMHALGLVP